ncbi:MAG TPA: SWIM zinc finger family protein [Pyrinomonadaceae bacterium]|nr:SWIM zinc finger family protein [Pyrinomonadaceae bacterium]
MARKRWYNDFYHFPKSVPRAAAGGIKAQSKQGGFGKSWWAKRWIGVLEGFNLGARLGRGRSYARRGQVVSIDIEAGVVIASVQGSRRVPYQVTIKIKTLSQADGKTLAQALSRQALFAAKLLANEMPQDIETVFQESNLSLFPSKLHDLKTDCSCPDWSNPCKHVAAVYYLLGEEFDRDPFLIFKLRGLDREKLIGLIGTSPETPEATRSGRGTGRKRRVQLPDGDAVPGGDGLVPRGHAPALSGLAADPISAELTGFWQGADLSAELSTEVQAPPVAAPLLKRLGSFPFWRSDRRFLDAFEPIYQRASQQAMKVFVGESLRTKK